MHSYSIRSRLILIATLVLVIALGLVGIALNSANYRGAVSSLQARMESYVYLVLAAMEVDASGRLKVEDDFADPRLTQPGSGLYILISGRDAQWRSGSSLGVDLPELPQAEAGNFTFTEPGEDNAFFSFQYGVDWQLADDEIKPFTVSVQVDPSEIEQQTSAFRLGLLRSLGTAAAILVLGQMVILALVFRPLGRVAQDVARIESGQSTRLRGNYPRELEPLARNVNRLLETEQSNRERIRNALDSLAHSLKTPLAVIQASIALKSSAKAQPNNESKQSGEASFDRDAGGADKRDVLLQNAVTEMSRLIATRMERAGSSTRRTLAEPVAVQPQLQRTIDSLQKIYSHKMIETEVILVPGLKFFGREKRLAGTHGKPAGQRVQVRNQPCQSDRGRDRYRSSEARLVVADRG